MQIYHVTAWCTIPHYTTFEVDAGTIDEALEKAKEQAQDEYPEPCNGTQIDWDEFEISPEGDEAELRYLEPLRLAEIAAEDLLRAAEFALPLLETLGDGRGDREQEREAFYKLRDAIAKATGGAV